MAFYLLGAGIYFVYLTSQMLMDRKCSNYDLGSWIIIAIATTLWIIVIPVSLLEIFNKNKAQFDKINKSTLEEEQKSNFHTFIY